MPTAVVIGASSGIGREIALQLSARGFRVAICSRNLARLQEVSALMGGDHSLVKELDMSRAEHAIEVLLQFQSLLATIDYIYLVAGTGYLNADLDWPLEGETVAVNCVGFAALASASVKIFQGQGRGHLVAVTSVAAARPSGAAPAYGASKAFASSYVEALRYWARRQGLPLTLTEVRPGFVDTAMMKVKNPIWVISPSKAAAGIIRAADRRKKRVYVPARWWIVAQLMRIIPDAWYARAG